MKTKINRLIARIIFTVTVLSTLSTVPVCAAEADFDDGVYTYTGTGYTTGDADDGELVCKIDKYYYENSSDLMYCAVDDYFYKRDSAGTVIDKNCYGYAVARFEKGSYTSASSGRVYGTTNVTAWSDGCGNWSYKPHYYGTTLY